ncbi:MAG: RHS repeat protein [Rhodocyclales bacterium]|nr:RHS repeat protein [Rhodocyclales bacterium]
MDPKNNGPECGSTNNPIAIGTGNKWLVERDVAGALGFSRTYNSNPATPSSVFGEHWMGSHTQRLGFDESGGVRAIRADGKVFRFTASGSGYTADADVVERLSAEFGSGGTPVGYRLETADHGVERYDVAGRLLSHITVAGQVLTMAYDGANRLSGVSDAFGRSLALTYDADGRVATLTNPAGGITRYAYDVIGNLTGVTYPDGKSRAYQYDHPPFRSHLTGITDEHGVQFATYYYDDQGRATSESLAGGVDEASLSYAADSTTVADALGSSRTYHFNTVQGRVRSTGQSQPDGAGCSAAASTRSYDANGNAISHTDFNGVTTTYQYDPARNLETQRVEASGLPEARAVSTQWHGYWRAPIKVAEPLKITTYVYNGDGGVYCAPANATIPGRSGGTHPIKVLCSRSEQATTDADGSQAFGAAPTGSPRAWKWTYNAYGQVLTTDGPRTDVADTTTMTYYPANDPVIANRGHVATVINALGHVTQYGAYDLNGNPLSIINPNGEITTLAYDARQRLTRRTQGAKSTYYGYDAAGQLKQVNLPDGGTLNYTYDAAHRLTRISDGLGNHVSYSLDGAGNRVAETIKDGNQVLFQNITRVFDALSRVQSEQR